MKYYDYDGEKYTIEELSKKFNIKKRTLYSRLNEKKWSVVDAIDTPIKKYGDDSVEINKKFNYLTVIKIVGRSKLGRVAVKCKCDCGRVCVKEYTFVKNSKVKTCGKCNLALVSSAHNRKGYHGLRDKRVYHSWRAMLNRCYNKNNVKYKSYGGRGIKVCGEWKNNFLAFYKWSIDNGYRDDLTIDRIDVNGDYTPENCRWVDIITQANNKTNTIKILFKNKLYNVRELSKLLNVSKYTIVGRYYRGTLGKLLLEKEQL